jgi:DMSO/TMAO reductase YedYZ heme-binding membrane subunit
MIVTDRLMFLKTLKSVILKSNEILKMNAALGIIAEYWVALK